MTSATGSIARTGHRTETERSWVRAWPYNRPAVLRILGGALLLLGVWTSVGLLYVGFLDDGPVGDADRRVSVWFEDHRTDTINTLTHYGSMMSETLVKIALLAVVGTTMVVVWRRWHDGTFLVLAVIVESSVFAASSLIVDRDRPPVTQLDSIPPSGSFPSGHSAAAVAFYGGLYVVARWHTRRRDVRALFLTIGIVVPLVVATSRVARGMHHLSDVIAGLALGVATLLVLQASLRAGVAELERRSLRGPPYPERTLSLEMAATGHDETPARQVDANAEARR